MNLITLSKQAIQHIKQDRIKATIFDSLPPVYIDLTLEATYANTS